jgi:hypothetical protein
MCETFISVGVPITTKNTIGTGALFVEKNKSCLFHAVVIWDSMQMR